MNLPGQFVDAEPHRLQELLSKDLARVNVPSPHGCSAGIPPPGHNFPPASLTLSVVVNDFYLVRISFLPEEAHAIWAVNADAVLPGAISLKFLQMIAGRNA